MGWRDSAHPWKIAANLRSLKDCLTPGRPGNGEAVFQTALRFRAANPGYPPSSGTPGYGERTRFGVRLGFGTISPNLMRFDDNSSTVANRPLLTVTAIPEPGILMLVGFALGSLMLFRRRK